jgi:hypothetical protein
LQLLSASAHLFAFGSPNFGLKDGTGSITNRTAFEQPDVIA